MKQTERQERSRGMILQAALEEFGTQGYDRVSMETICSRHGISKGMMYHYYSNKDELFLVCAKLMYQALETRMKQKMEEFSQCPALDAVKGFFVLRLDFFQEYPYYKTIFEAASIHPPKHLTERLAELHAPVRRMNKQFLQRHILRTNLRPGLTPEQAERYFESISAVFRLILVRYETEDTDAYQMLHNSEELLQMILFGILQEEQS